MHTDITLHGTQLRLFSQRAIYWPNRETLFVADTHFGKDATFRRHGIPVPTGSTLTTLGFLSQLLEVTAARQLVILGDLFHARSSLARNVCDAVSGFCHQHADVEKCLVRGNHDTHVGQLPAEWSIEVVEPGTRMDNIALGHYPMKVPAGADLLLCGHVHPALALGRGQDRLRSLPCFWLSAGCLVLPAIGQFTGTHAIELAPGERAWVVADDQLIEQHR